MARLAKTQEYTTNSAQETIALGERIAANLQPNSIICFFGDLAAGKTTFIKGLASKFTGCDVEEVNSPTFVYLNIYGEENKLFHFDLYRLKDSSEFLALGFDEYLYANGIACIEWSERIHSILPKECIRIEMKSISPDQRKIIIVNPLENND